MALSFGVIVLLVLIAVSGVLLAFASGDNPSNHNGGRDGQNRFATQTGIAGQSPTVGGATATPTPMQTSSPTDTPAPTITTTPTVAPTPSPPCLTTMPLTLTYNAAIGSGNDPSPQSITLTNCSNQVSSWSGVASTTDGAPWLNFRGSPDTQNISFTMNPGDMPGDTLTYQIDALVTENNLQPGSYTGALTFTSSDNSRTVTISVSLTVTP